MVACADVRTVVYKLVLEGTVPEADDERVRGFLARIFGETAVSQPVSENFPREIPGEFDFQRASEWMQALARAGVRSRVEISGSSNESAPEYNSDLSEPESAKHPIRFWLDLLTDPSQAFIWLKNVGPWPGIFLGLALVCLGNILAYPGELWLLRSVFSDSAEAASTFKLTAILVFVEPVARLLFETIGVLLAIRLLGAHGTLLTTAGVVGSAHALDIVKVLPILGPAIAWFAWLWLTTIGLIHLYDLDQKRAIAFVLLPFSVAIVGLASIALTVILLLGALDVGALSDLSDGMSFR